MNADCGYPPDGEQKSCGRMSVKKDPGSLRDKMADYVERKSHKMQNCGLQILAGIL